MYANFEFFFYCLFLVHLFEFSAKFKFLTVHKGSVLKDVTEFFIMIHYKKNCTNIGQQIFERKNVKKSFFKFKIFYYLSVTPLTVVHCICLSTFIEFGPTVVEIQRPLKIQYGCRFHGNIMF